MALKSLSHYQQSIAKIAHTLSEMAKHEPKKFSLFLSLGLHLLIIGWLLIGFSLIPHRTKVISQLSLSAYTLTKQQLANIPEVTKLFLDHSLATSVKPPLPKKTDESPAKPKTPLPTKKPVIDKKPTTPTPKKSAPPAKKTNPKNEKIATDSKKTPIKSSDNAQTALAREIRQEKIDNQVILIIQAISDHWISPANAKDSDFCKLLVSLNPKGEIIELKVAESSGNRALERSGQAAILKASPLPVPEEPAIFNEIKKIKITFKPEGVVGN